MEEELKEKQCNCNEKCNCKDNYENEKKCNCNEKKEHKKNKTKELEETINNLNEELLRSKADLINYRRRKDDEVSKMYKYCNEELIKQLLPIVDNFERAIKLDDNNLDDNLSKFLDGFKMIYCSLVKTLEDYGVKAIDGSNKPFDPTYHQAVLTEKGETEGMVLEVLQKGYLLKDKVIRPAMVKVSE